MKEKLERLSGRVVFLKNEFEGIVLKSTPGTGGKYYVKFAGEKPYEIKHSSKLVTETILEWNEITKEEYNAF